MKKPAFPEASAGKRDAKVARYPKCQRKDVGKTFGVSQVSFGFLLEQAWIKVKWLNIQHHNLMKIRVERIDQDIVFLGNNYRWNPESQNLLVVGKLSAKRLGIYLPVIVVSFGWQKVHDWKPIRETYANDHIIIWNFANLQMSQNFCQAKCPGLTGVEHGRSLEIPTATITLCPSAR